ncbi:MAG: RsmB/NOP family class I SAM-dependent RNA methyltransferase [Alphaproteobacteria bacterium]|nr:RsmB/NOP family class I SAM-dependent RNA methyltransferase [Alphaproteobacteria bacterium]
MTPASLEKHTAVLMERISKKPFAANELINSYISEHKHFNKADKSALLEAVWRTIRFMARLKYLYPSSTWEERARALLEKERLNLKAAPDYIKWEVPEWFPKHVPEAEKELPELLENPPIVLRAIGDRFYVQKILQEEGINTYPTKLSPYGLILSMYCNLTPTKAWQEGLVEVQDEGAQLVALDIGVKPNNTVFDFCAGAGGKSLIFAQMMQNKGLIWAYDITVKKLFELVKRAKRAHIDIIEIQTQLPPPVKQFDYVVVDAPCSGTGTWRRNPHMRWHLTEKQLMHIAKSQTEILNRSEAYVKEGGHLAYITCSLTSDENENQIELFLQSHPNYKVIKQKRYSPYRTGTDGFFLCLMEKG